MDGQEGFGQTAEEREAFFHALMEAAFDGILITRDGIVVEASATLLAASGYTAQEMVGRPVTEFVTQEFREQIEDRQQRNAEGRFEAVAVLKNGRELQIEIVARTFYIGGRRSRITAIRDVTEKRRIEAHLRQTQKMEALGRLASGIAHDFNNILSVVRSYSDLLLQDLSEPHRGDALEILKAADQGAALTRQLLEFSRHQLPSPTPTDVNALVRDSERMLRRVIGGQIVLRTELASDLELINADSSQLHQVMLNLTINARDAMPAGGRIQIKTRNVDLSAAQLPDGVRLPAGRYVLLAVTDSGTGMSSDVQEQIFRPFFTTKGPERGTGLGLSTVREIVEQSRGFIVVDSTVGVGTTFAVYFPALPG